MNILIAYFSYTGHTRGIAQKIKEFTNGTLFELQPASPYSDDYDTTEAQGRKETRNGFKPELAEHLNDIDSYDTILIGTPNWFNTIAPPVATFLSEYDMTNKTIVPFCTNGGGGLGHIVTDIQKLCNGATVLNALNLYEDGGANAGTQIEKWLKINEINA